jgi:hypothetical protein
MTASVINELKTINARLLELRNLLPENDVNGLIDSADYSFDGAIDSVYEAISFLEKYSKII